MPNYSFVVKKVAKQTDRVIIFGLQLMWRHVLAFQKEWTISQLSIILILRENNKERESGKNTVSSLFSFSTELQGMEQEKLWK